MATSTLPPIPEPSFMGMGDVIGSQGQYIPADIEYSTPELEPDLIERQWRVFQSKVGELTVRGGTVHWGITDPVAGIVVEPITLETPTEEWFIWCKITVAGEDATAAILETGDTIPVDTDTKKHWLICEIFSLYPEGDFYHGIRQIQFEPIRKLTDAAGINHPWKVTRTEMDTLDYIGGIIYDHNQPHVFVTITVPDGGLAIVEGVVYLKIERDTESRLIVSATVNIAAALPPDDYVNQHFRLAKVVEDEPILQLQFQDIKVYEMLVVANGEFKFGNFQMFGDSLNDLPT